MSPGLPIGRAYAFVGNAVVVQQKASLILCPLSSPHAERSVGEVDADLLDGSGSVIVAEIAGVGVYVRSLATGKTHAIDVSADYAQVEAEGLYYAYDRGTVVFVPMNTLRQWLAR